MKLYALDGATPRPCTPEEWNRAVGCDAYLVAKEKVGDAWVITRFVGVDTRVFPEGNPALWETSVFRPCNKELYAIEAGRGVVRHIRSHTREEARSAHERAAQSVRDAMPQGELKLEAS